MSILERLQARYELYRLEQRYTRREKRTAFISEARYVNGEYIYASLPIASASESSVNRRFSRIPAGVKDFSWSGSTRS